MKKIIFFFYLCFYLNVITSFAQYSIEPAERHVKIYANVKENNFFYDLQKELNINPKVANYIIYLNTYFSIDEFSEKPEDNIELDLGDNFKYTFRMNSVSETTRNKLFRLRGSSVEFLESSNPAMWSYFLINAKKADDSLFSWVQQDLQIHPVMENFQIIVDIRSTNPPEKIIIVSDKVNSYKKLWSDISSVSQFGLLNWTAMNKINLNKKPVTFATPIVNNLSELKNQKISIGKPETNFSKLLKSSFNIFQNNYFQFFGGERTGIPIRNNIGLLLGTGTKYSGPAESDEVSIGLSLYGISFSYITRVLFLQYNFGNYFNSSDYNKINVKPAIEIKADIPFGDYLSLSYLKIVDEDVLVWQMEHFYSKKNELVYLPSNKISRDYFNFELKYPFNFFNSEKAQIYLAYYMKEVNFGFYSRESRIANSVFDFRTNFTFTQMRNFQILMEVLFSGFSQSFGMNCIAIGPSFRFSKLINHKFGLHTLLLNVRFKLGADI